MEWNCYAKDAAEQGWIIYSCHKFSIPKVRFIPAFIPSKPAPSLPFPLLVPLLSTEGDAGGAGVDMTTILIYSNSMLVFST